MEADKNMPDRELKIKVCGMREPNNVKEVAALHPDYMGFIFFEKSPRCCFDMNPVIVRSLPHVVTPVVVTVDMEIERLEKIASEYGITTLQLHGSETPDDCRRLKEKGFTVWKAFSINPLQGFGRMKEYVGDVDMFLFDTPTADRGGSGRKFDWSLISDYDLPMRFMLSGGIAPGDEEAVRGFRHPMLEGIDLNSRFETKPGHKDVAELKEFMSKL